MKDIAIVAVGGYNEIGRNMTAIKIGKDIVVMDMGIRLDRVQIHEDTDVESLHAADLIAMGAIPDDSIMNNIDGKVRAIACTHGHLDHIGAISKLAHKYHAPIVATPFTSDLISQEIKSEKIFGVNNPVKTMNAGERFAVTEDIELEFVRVQHSIVDCVFAAIHTPKGTIIYANDYKIDRSPTLGEPPDFARLRKLGKEGVLALITETTNAGISGKTPSEQIAKDLVWDVITGTEESKSGIMVTTFSSHIARIRAIIEAAHKIGRKPVLLGRSMEKYWGTAVRTGYAKQGEVTVYGRRKSVDKALKRIMTEGKDKYLPIMTGHQGEPGAILSRVANGETDYLVESGDKAIFSAGTIPQPLNVSNRHTVVTKVKMRGGRIYDNVHVSGHACREDHWELLRMINPEHVIPSHGNLVSHGNYLMMAEETGYSLGSNIHLVRNGQELLIDSVRIMGGNAMDEELGRRAALVSQAIERLMPIVHPQGLYQASRHLVDSGGKRLRPSMLLLAAEAAGGSPEGLVPAAVSIELVHNFTLIHDDIMDNADVRRGRPAVHKLWGVPGAILAGDTLYSKAFSVLGLAEAEPRLLLDAMNMLSRTCTAICEGQWLDMEFESRDSVSEAEYMEMIEKKTGVLYGAAAAMGGILAGAAPEVVQGLDEYGRLTGMGFQLQDDVLDLTAPEKVLGKRLGGDLIEGKKTLIMIHAFANHVAVDAFSRKGASAEEIERSIAVLEKSGSIDYARTRAEALVEKGKRALDVLPDTPARALLLDLADYMIRRRY